MSIRNPQSATHNSADPIDAALAEDMGSGDVTCEFFVDASRHGQARIFAKAKAVVAGAETAAEVFHRVDSDLQIDVICGDGEAVESGDTVLEVRGAVRSILTAERVALNFLQRLSGVATLTRRFVEAVAGTRARILDTRKTTPGLRRLEKAAVVAGGGTNHRFGLFDMVMVKDNHLAADCRPEHLQAAIRAALAAHPGMRIEVEADSLPQVRTFLALEGIDVILLDNMNCAEMSEAVRLGTGRVQFEASGGVTLDTVGPIAATGVDFISIGALTHSAPRDRFFPGASRMMPPDARMLVALRSATVHLPASDLASLSREPEDAAETSIRSLRAAGFDIEFRPGFGYRLLGCPDRIIADDLWARFGCRAPALVREILVFEETASTNDLAAQFGRRGAPAGLAIFAERQTAGRGRFGRRWESSAHCGLWFSLLLRPALEIAHWPRLTTWAAVAVAAALERTINCRAEIKWPNDICLRGRKVAGILIEMGTSADQTPFAVVGIGLNINHEEQDFPLELRESAVSLRQVTGHPMVRAEIAVGLLRELDKHFARIGPSFEEIIAEAGSRSLLLGHWIQAQSGECILEGVAEELDGDGHLLLRLADGSRTKLSAGEVTLHGAGGGVRVGHGW